MHPILQQLQRSLIVSSQASQGEPLDTPEILCALAKAALNGGARGIRMAQPRNLSYFRERHPNVPLIGITKPEKIPTDADSLVYITPTFQDICTIAPLCDIVALDATQRNRPNGESLREIVIQVRQQWPTLLLMADIATIDDGKQAMALGFDVIGTTLAGYTSETKATASPGPEFKLLEELLDHQASLEQKIPVILEGRVWEPDDIRQGFVKGAHAVVVGSAITRPHDITRRFVQAIPSTV
jgi:N-acylglucosamine-6-phosphate 2-epimerase